MTEHEQLKRLRILRRDAYRCGHRDERSILCGAKASDVDVLFKHAVCDEHAQPAG